MSGEAIERQSSPRARSVDARFALPFFPQSAVVLGGLDRWTSGLREAGVEIVEERGTPELVVAPARQAREALALRARAVLVEGRMRGAERLLGLPRVIEPRLLLHLQHRHAARYALLHMAPGPSSLRRVAAALAGRGLALPGGTVLSILANEAPPSILAAARDVGVAGGAWFLAFDPGSDRKRCAFFVFEGDVPGYVVKFARLPGLRDPFDRDERGLSLASAAGGTVAAHAPRLLGRFEVEGHHASLETAATGASLRRLLSGRSSREVKLAAIERVVRWILTVARETARPGPRGFPSVFAHNDLWDESVRVDAGGELTVIDWEFADAAGMPLWDVLFFSVHAFASLDGSDDASLVALFRGRSPSSRLLLRWVREAAADLGLAPTAVSELAASCWEHHASRALASRHAREQLEARRIDPYLPERVARLWSAGAGKRWLSS